MDIIYRSFGYFKNMYNQLNPATLTGAIDIVVVEQQDGTYLASPFHVRFGKLGVLRAKEKLVKIKVNDERIRDLHMKLGDQGEAFFVQEVPLEEDDMIPTRLITSPLPSRPETPTEKLVEKQRSAEKEDDNTSPLAADDGGKRKRRKKRKKRTAVLVGEDGGGAEGANQSEEEEKMFVVGAAEEKLLDMNKKARTLSEPLEDEIRDNNRAQPTMRGFLSDSEIPTPKTEQENGEVTLAPFSDSETAVPVHHSKSGSMMWGWGQLPSANESGQESSSDDSSASNSASRTPPCNEDETVFRTIPSCSCDEMKQIDTTAVEISVKAKDTEAMACLPRSNVNNNNKPTPAGLYLDDVLSLNPSEANRYLQQPSSISNSVEATSTTVAERASSPGGGSDIDSGTDSQTHEDNTNENISASMIPDARISLCGLPSGSTAVDQEKFVEKEVSFSAFLQNPAAILGDPNLVFKIGDRYMNWQAAAPALVSFVVYKQQLTKENVDRFVQSAQPQQSKGIVGWFFRKPKPPANENQIRIKGKVQVENSRMHPVSASSPDMSNKLPASRTRNNTENLKSDAESEIVDILQSAEMKRSLSEQSLYSSSVNQFVFTSTTTVAAGGKVLRKTTRLNSDQLASLGLIEGANKIEFSVTTQYQGTSKCQATIYLWKWYDKIVVSDIDGTITKSDVFGQILPVVGKDWTQGGVAKLYQNIGRNGYKFMYLSARAIGQASMTKNYLNWIDQQEVCLPPGTLFLSPTSLMIAFRREVIEKKPEKFKIDCLKDIKALFPTNPFSAGFGNKTSDVIAYTAVGIPDDRMFTINHKGELRQEVMQTYITSYNDLGETVDHFFPPLDPNEEHEFQARGFSDFSYWRDDILTMINENDDFRLT